MQNVLNKNLISQCCLFDEMTTGNFQSTVSLHGTYNLNREKRDKVNPLSFCTDVGNTRSQLHNYI